MKLKARFGFRRWMQAAACALACAALLAGRPAAAPADEAKPAPPGRIGFVGKNKVATANSAFENWKFTKVEIDRANPEKSVVELEVDVASLSTGIKKRDDHLRTADFFDVKKFPTAAIRIYDAKPKDTGADAQVYQAKMDVTIKGIKKTFSFDFTAVKMQPLEIEGKIAIKRSEFGVGEAHNKLNPMSVEDEIPITFKAAIPEK